jgi:hypothetical protein
VIAILDVETDELKIVELGKDDFPADLQWVGNSGIIGTSYKIPVWRLGLVYCSNRESLIFSVQVDGNNLRKLVHSHFPEHFSKCESDFFWIMKDF